MKNASVNELTLGMVVASDVMTNSGQRILDKGNILTPQMIMRLSFYGITSIDVIEAEPQPDTPAPTPEPAVSKPVTPTKTMSPVLRSIPKEETPKKASVYTQKLKSSQESQSFQIQHTLSTSLLRTSFEAFVNEGAPLQTDLLLDNVRKLFYSCKTSRDLFDMLHNLRSSGETVYFHALNVALLCRQIGKWLKVSDTQLDMLTLCGLLHDIGKLKIPQDILNKPGKYTDEEYALVKMHPQYGYELLQPLSLDDHIKKAARSHHERCDGSGYPSGLHQEDLDEYAMVVSIADVYDAMTAARSYRAPLCPFQVIASFEDEGLKKYKPKYILTFLSHIASIYQNNRIMLSDGRVAKIVMLNSKALSKPIVQLDDGTCIDLSTELSLHIQSVM